MKQTAVLVVGAGPTGLTLACDLARRGVSVRIVDEASEFTHGSRRKGLNARSLEVLDDLGVVDRMLESGVTHMLHRKYRGAKVVAETDPEADHVKPYLIGASGLVDDGGHASRAYGEDVLVLVRPDGYVGLLAGADDTQTLSDYLHSLMAFQAIGPARSCLRPGAAASAYPSGTHDQQH
jgi:threonine dehydrogenase-like Zn-dependent dehydrogenase